MQLNTRLWTTH